MKTSVTEVFNDLIEAEAIDARDVEESKPGKSRDEVITSDKKGRLDGGDGDDHYIGEDGKTESFFFDGRHDNNDEGRHINVVSNFSFEDRDTLNFRLDGGFFRDASGDTLTQSKNGNQAEFSTARDFADLMLHLNSKTGLERNGTYEFKTVGNVAASVQRVDNSSVEVVEVRNADGKVIREHIVMNFDDTDHKEDHIDKKGNFITDDVTVVFEDFAETLAVQFARELGFDGEAISNADSVHIAKGGKISGGRGDNLFILSGEADTVKLVDRPEGNDEGEHVNIIHGFDLQDDSILLRFGGGFLPDADREKFKGAAGLQALLTYADNVNDSTGDLVFTLQSVEEGRDPLTIVLTNVTLADIAALAPQPTPPVLDGPLSLTLSEDDAVGSLELLDGATDTDRNDHLSVENLFILSGDAAGISFDGNRLEVDPSVYQSLTGAETETITVTYDVVDIFGNAVAQTATVTIVGDNDLADGDETDTALSTSGQFIALQQQVRDEALAELAEAEAIRAEIAARPSYPEKLNDLRLADADVLFARRAVNSIEEQLGASIAEATLVNVLANASDDAGLGVSVSAVAGDASYVGQPVAGSNGGLFTISTDGTVLFLGNGDFDDVPGRTSVDTSISYSVTNADGETVTSTLTVSVEGPNHAPDIAGQALDVGEDSEAVIFTPVVTDIDAGETFTFSINPGASLGIWIDNGDGTFSYDPNGAFDLLDTGETATETATVTVTDALGVSSSAVLTATIIGEDEPVVDTGLTDGDEEVAVGLLDGTTLIALETAYIETDATYVEAQEAYDAAVARGVSGFGLINFLITRDNALTAFNAAEAAYFEFAETETPNVLSNAVDTIGGGVSVRLVNGEAPGQLVEGNNGGLFLIQADGNSVFYQDGSFADLSAGEDRTTSVTYTVEDGAGGFNTSTLSVVITGTNSAPSATLNDLDSVFFSRAEIYAALFARAEEIPDERNGSFSSKNPDLLQSPIELVDPSGGRFGINLSDPEDGIVAIDGGWIFTDNNGDRSDVIVFSDVFRFQTVEGGFVDIGVTVKPVLDHTPPDPVYTDGGNPVVIAPTIALQDTNDADLVGATVAITSGFDAGGDVLLFADQNGITGSFDAATGILALMGTASVADYEAALASVTFGNGADVAATSQRVIEIIVDDSQLKSSPLLIGLGVVATDTADETAEANVVDTVGEAETFNFDSVPAIAESSSDFDSSEQPDMGTTPFASPGYDAHDLATGVSVFHVAINLDIDADWLVA